MIDAITIELELLSALLTFLYIILLLREHTKVKHYNSLFPHEKKSLSDQIVSRKGMLAGTGNGKTLSVLSYLQA